MRRAVERTNVMAALRGSYPLGNHRARLAQYLRGIVLSSDTVAGHIIGERRSGAYASDPVRPALVLWACDSLRGDLTDALPVAAAFDLFDRFLMLHEELTREPAPAVARWGLGQSLNAGDALYALAFRCLASDVCNAGTRLETARLVAQAVLEAVEERDEAARSAALTGSALQAGAVIAGAGERIAGEFRAAGRSLVVNPGGAVAALAQRISAEDALAFEAVARYVARRVA
jgi:hypothetical protein